jgi:hypothetical protein
VDALYLQALQNMERTLNGLVKGLPPPQRVPILDSFVYRYVERTIQQAIVQKLARIISGLYAARILLEAGFLQEQAALQRMLDEFQEDVTFLSLGVIFDDVTDLHRRYLDAFFEEEFDKPDDAVGSTQRRAMVPRDKLRAYIARIEGDGLNHSRGVALGRTLSKAYSGYVHGASPQIMEMYGGDPPYFHVAGMRSTPRFGDHQDDLWNYFYRGICAFAFAAKAFRDDSLVKSIGRFSDQFTKASGKDFGAKPENET